MNILVLDKFYKSVPKDKEQKVKQKVKALVQELRDSKYNFERLSKSSSLRKIAETDRPIYKFKFNEGDRILCTLYDQYYRDDRQEYKGSFVLLEYCTHDKQIMKARNKDFGKQKLHRLDQDAADNTWVLVDGKENRLVDFSLLSSTPFLISQDQIESLFGEDGHLYYLDREQYDCAVMPQSQLVLGAAGSGKTMISAYKLANYIREHRGEHFRLGYFTYSRRLKEKVERLFEDICVKLYGLSRADFAGKVDFLTMEEQLESAGMNGKRANLISYAKFKEWYTAHTSGQRQPLDPLALWKERRGIVQGIIGVNWQDDIVVRDSRFEPKVLKQLHDQRYINYSQEPGTFKLLKPLHDICTYLNRYYGSSDHFRECVVRSMNETICATPELLDEPYMGLSASYSMLSPEQRQKALAVFKKYKPFVQHQNSQNFFEEGERVRSALAHCAPQYDFMVVDEVQDLTEVQVYYLCQLLKRKSNIFVCGDFHQTINPTFFHAGRIEAIFQFVTGTLFEKRMLTNNYRSSRSIVEFANSVAELRNRTIRTKQQFEWQETANRDYTRQPILFKGQKDSLFHHIEDKSYVLVVVPNEQVKTELIGSYKQLESRVLTVSEVKGMERKYIVSYNMMSAYKQQWERIFNQTDKLNVELYRYYFNILYVSVTRARDVWCMIEDQLSEEMMQWLQSRVELIRQFDLKQLGLSENSTLEQQLQEAELLEQDEMYDQAIAAYEAVLKKEPGSFAASTNTGIQRCKVKKQYELDKDEAAAGQKLLQLREYDEAIPFLRKGGNAQQLLQALLLSDRCESYDVASELAKLGVSPLDELVERNDAALMNKFLDLQFQSYVDAAKNTAKTSETFAGLFTRTSTSTSMS